MKSNTDHITIGRNPVLTYQILDGIRRREIRLAQRKERVKSVLRTLTPIWGKGKKEFDK